MTYPRAMNTIGALIDGDYSLTVYCEDQDCQHSSTLDLDALASRLGRDHSSMHDDLAPKLRCTKCRNVRGNGVSLRMAPPTKSPWDR